jgi:hypothetical protein
MYLITDEQFNDIVLQENSMVVDGNRILPSFERLVSEDEQVLRVNGWYQRLLPVGEKDGYPIFTFTSAKHDLRNNPPGEAYIKTIASGLKETYPQLTNDDICEYLLGAEGLRGALPTHLLAEWVSSTGVAEIART